MVSRNYNLYICVHNRVIYCKFSIIVLFYVKPTAVCMVIKA